MTSSSMAVRGGGGGGGASPAALLATLEGALDARFPPSGDDGHLEAQLVRYINFATNLSKVRQLLAGIDWAAATPDSLREWLRQNIIVTMHAMVLELHLNGPPNLWQSVARYRQRQRLFTLLYLRMADMYLAVLSSMAERAAGDPRTADLMVFARVEVVSPALMQSAWQSVDLMLQVLLEQRSQHRENPNWRPSMRHLKLACEEHARRRGARFDFHGMLASSGQWVVLGLTALVLAASVAAAHGLSIPLPRRRG